MKWPSKIAEIEKSNLTEEVKRALSQNIGHRHTGTTFGIDGYGRISEDRQIEILKAFAAGGLGTSITPRMHPDDIALLIKGVAAEIKNSDSKEELHQRKQDDDDKGRNS